MAHLKLTLEGILSCDCAGRARDYCESFDISRDEQKALLSEIQKEIDLVNRQIDRLPHNEFGDPIGIDEYGLKLNTLCVAKNAIIHKKTV